jgi:hypothetical protein
MSRILNLNNLSAAPLAMSTYRLRFAVIAALFGNDEQGELLHISDTETTWQDTGATTPSTAVGHPIARVDGLVNSQNATQSTAGNRPVFALASGQLYARSDWVDDALLITLPDLGSDATIAYASLSAGAIIQQGQTISGEQSIPLDTAAVIYLDRALTAAEESTVRSWLDAVLNVPRDVHHASTNAPASSNQSLRIDTTGGGRFTIIWGDGTVSYSRPSISTVTKQYAAPYAGPVMISTNTGMTRWDSLAGHWNFDISQLPSGLTFYRNRGSNTTSGDISQLPVGLTSYDNRGSNTTAGDISQLPSGLTIYDNQGSNTTAGDISQLPAGLTLYDNRGSNTTSGDIGQLPAGLTVYQNQGNNTTAGDISQLPSGLTFYDNRGSNTASMPSTNWGAATVNYRLMHNVGAGMSQSDVDNLLVAADENVTSWAVEQRITLTGANAAPSSVGLAAKTSLEAKGVTVQVNS